MGSAEETLIVDRPTASRFSSSRFTAARLTRILMHSPDEESAGTHWPAIFSQCSRFATFMSLERNAGVINCDEKGRERDLHD